MEKLFEKYQTLIIRGLILIFVVGMAWQNLSNKVAALEEKQKSTDEILKQLDQKIDLLLQDMAVVKDKLMKE
jgi:prefoldin subunit 5